MENCTKLQLARAKTKELQIPLKIVEVGRNEEGILTFYFEAEKRVDFRNLVVELNVLFGENIRLEQIGSRDVAKKVGGIGPCGRTVCCCRFLKDFKSITTEIIKSQKLNNTLAEYTGLCGKLMCCLYYECSPEKIEELKKEESSQKVHLAQKKETTPEEKTEITTPSPKPEITKTQRIETISNPNIIVKEETKKPNLEMENLNPIPNAKPEQNPEENNKIVIPHKSKKKNKSHNKKEGKKKKLKQIIRIA